MKTATGEIVKNLTLYATAKGWAWELPEDQRLSAEDIAAINEELMEMGIVIDPDVLNFPHTQILCG